MILTEQIELLITHYLHAYLSNLSHYYTNVQGNTVEFFCKKTKEDASYFLLLRLGINLQNEEIYIYNIFLPNEDRKKRIGLGLIAFLFEVAKVLHFALVLADMTEGFRGAMLKRGAITTNLYDHLQVIDNTDLS